MSKLVVRLLMNTNNEKNGGIFLNFVLRVDTPFLPLIPLFALLQTTFKSNTFHVCRYSW